VGLSAGRPHDSGVLVTYDDDVVKDEQTYDEIIKATFQRIQRDEEFQALAEMYAACEADPFFSFRLDLKDLPGHGILSSKEPQ
jgi:hypothetical protein